jgi:biopolymer transport protein TolR
MGVSMGKTGRSEVADINMTPMIDVLLVLLVIFMIAQPLLQKSIDIQLPIDTNQPPPPDAANDNIVLEIGPNKTFAVNTRQVPANQLEDFLRKLYTGRPNKVIFVKADGSVKYQEVISAMDVARGAGVRVLGAVLPPAS